MLLSSQITRTFLLCLVAIAVVPLAQAQTGLDTEASDLVMESLPPPSKPSADSAPPVNESPDDLMDTRALDDVAPQKPETDSEDVPTPSETESAKNKAHIERVIIDPGHGGNDSGCEGPNDIKESAIVLDLANQLKQAIEKGRPTRVFLTRDKDKPCSRQSRVAAAISNKGDLLIQLHVAAALSPTACGAQIFCSSVSGPVDADVSRTGAAYSGQSLAMAERIAHKLAEVTETSPRVYQIPSAVFADVPMPAVLVEVGFLTNPDEAVLLSTPEYQERLVAAITGAIMAEPLTAEGDKP